MFTLLFSLRDCLRSRAVLQAEILALHHQLLVFERSRRGHNLRLRWTDRALWVWLSRLAGTYATDKSRLITPIPSFPSSATVKNDGQKHKNQVQKQKNQDQKQKNDDQKQ
jgi:hypothetical protein